MGCRPGPNTIGTFRPLWVPAWCGSAFYIFLLRQFFLGIPRELREAAVIDGLGWFGIFVRIYLPLSKNALISAGIILFIGIGILMSVHNHRRLVQT